MTNKTATLLAIALIAFTGIMATASIINDSLTMDELAHLPAGYSYLTQKDMRLNPEHPPLIKDLSAFPLLFIRNIRFPYEIKSWTQDINGQWDFGNHFLFKTGNPAEKMIFWSRIPMILLLMVLGIYVFLFAKNLFGKKAGLLALFFYSFSPTLLAHGRLVTTDVGAAAGVFISTYYFIKFLKKSSLKNLVLAGVFLGLAELAKFSLVLLIPFFALITVIWILLKSTSFREFLKTFGFYFVRCLMIIVIGYVLVWGVYQYHTFGYPPERQKADTEFLLSSFGNRPLANAVVWMSDKPVLRPAAQYTLGLFMVLQRASGGNTGYFLGEVSAAGWKYYFPVVYFIKEPLAFHILSLVAGLYVLWVMLKRKPSIKGLKEKIYLGVKAHFPEIAMLLFINIYWITSMRSNLNIGVRHLLPIFPFAVLLLSGGLTAWLKPPILKIKTVFLVILMLWQAYSVISVYPHFIAYFNELAGGPENGYKWVVDSNLDWGQDLKRLKIWLDKNNVDKIYLDYFGGSDTNYYLKEKYSPWWGDRNPNEIPEGSYLAVSATLLQGGTGKAAPGFDSPTGYYNWLIENYRPIDRIGYSIFIFKIDPLNAID